MTDRRRGRRAEVEREEAGEGPGLRSLTLEAGWTHDERLLEGVRPGTDLGRSRLQGQAPLGHCSHGRR